MLADMTGATDERLRALARRLAGRIVIGLARADAARRRGIGKMRSLPMDDTGGDLDMDASLEVLQLARPPAPHHGPTSSRCGRGPGRPWPSASSSTGPAP